MERVLNDRLNLAQQRAPTFNVTIQHRTLYVNLQDQPIVVE